MAKSRCAACGATFASVTAFDRHRVGAFATRGATHGQGARRCLTPQEMLAQGMERNARDWWATGAKLQPNTFTRGAA